MNLSCVLLAAQATNYPPTQYSGPDCPGHPSVRLMLVVLLLLPELAGEALLPLLGPTQPLKLLGRATSRLCMMTVPSAKTGGTQQRTCTQTGRRRKHSTRPSVTHNRRQSHDYWRQRSALLFTWCTFGSKPMHGYPACLSRPCPIACPPFVSGVTGAPHLAQRPMHKVCTHVLLGFERESSRRL